MDNESFLNYTCGPSQEFAQDDVDGEEDAKGFVGEGDGEGFVDDPTPRRASR
jgi:hypothetical protein